MHEFAGEECEAGDLRLREGEELLVLSKRDDGWWKARRRKPMVGELDEGWVPSNYLRVQAGARSDGASKSTEVANCCHLSNPMKQNYCWFQASGE